MIITGRVFMFLFRPDHELNMLMRCFIGSFGEKSLLINQPNQTQVIKDQSINVSSDTVEISTTEKLRRREEWERAIEKDRFWLSFELEKVATMIRIEEERLQIQLAEKIRVMQMREIEEKERLRLVAVFKSLVVSDQSYSSDKVAMISIATHSVKSIKISNCNILQLHFLAPLLKRLLQITQEYGLYKATQIYLQRGTEEEKLLQCNLLQLKSELLKLNCLLHFITLILTTMIPLFFWLQVQFLLKWYSIDHIRCILNVCARFIHHDECWGYTSAGEWLRPREHMKNKMAELSFVCYVPPVLHVVHTAWAF